MRKRNLSNLHENKDMKTLCVYIDFIFSRIGKGKKYHIFEENDLSYSSCYCGPGNKEYMKKIVRLGDICSNCHREIVKEIAGKGEQ